jgi:hypothetical protein
MMRRWITADEARSLFSYDAETGEIRWRVSLPGYRSGAGDIAGGVYSCGYRIIGVYRRQYLAHRLAWFIQTGEWPVDEVDHINGRRSDNRWCNLRPATPSQQAINRKSYSNNKSGQKGVTWAKRERKWRAHIAAQGRRLVLGEFRSFEEACAARLDAERLYHGEYARAA